MTEPFAITRELVHTRTVDLRSYRRSDGLWDIEGRLVDVRAEPVETPVLRLAAHEPMHDMRLTLTIDGDMTIVAAHADMPSAATPECHQIQGRYEALVGLRIGAGFRKAVAAVASGVLGCTHMTILVQAMAAAAVQALWHDRADSAEGLPGWAVNACYGYREGSDAVRVLAPQFHVSGIGADESR